MAGRFNLGGKAFNAEPLPDQSSSTGSRLARNY